MDDPFVSLHNRPWQMPKQFSESVLYEKSHGQKPVNLSSIVQNIVQMQDHKVSPNLVGKAFYKDQHRCLSVGPCPIGIAARTALAHQTFHLLRASILIDSMTAKYAYLTTDPSLGVVLWKSIE